MSEPNCAVFTALRRLPATGIALAATYVPVAAAQWELQREPYSLTVEAAANLTSGFNLGEDGNFDYRDFSGRVDAELRTLALADLGADAALGLRLTWRTDLEPGESEGRIGERSVLALGRWGRAEIGWRRGLPDVLTGYAPNAYQFVSAEYGPASGASLDPDGGLAVRFLPAPLGAQIQRLSGLGVTAGQFFDESPKLIYVAPKVGGFLGGVSYAPDADDDAFGRLTQFGLVHERYWEQNVLRVGGTFAHAQGEHGARDLDSFSLGASLTLDDALTLAASYSRDGDGGLPDTAAFASSAKGYAFSVNYNTGPWTVGGFYQLAHAEDAADQPGDDRLNALGLGASYRTSTRMRIFAALYHYDLRDEGKDDFDGEVVLLGVRLTL